MDSIWHILSAIAVISVPFVTWLISMHNRLLKSETLLEERSKTLKEVSSQQAIDSHRITQHDSTITAVRDSLQEFRGSIDRRLTEVGTRLDTFAARLELLPSMSAHLEVLAGLNEKIVPREVYDAQFLALDSRVGTVEDRLNTTPKFPRSRASSK
jgi:hypothetical protein